MTRRSVQTALTLYGAGTLTRAQAASRAGVSRERFDVLCERFGLPTADLDATGAAASRPASAD